MSHAVTRDRCRGPGRTTGLSPKGCPTVSSQICPTPDPESACLCRDLTRNSAFHSRKSTNPLRSRSLVMQRRGWGQYRSGQGRSRAAGTTQFVYGERFALLRQWLVCLRVRAGAAVCPWAGLAVCLEDRLDGRHTAWPNPVFFRPCLKTLISYHNSKNKRHPTPPSPPPHPQSKWLYLGENWPWASRQAPKQIRSSSIDECTAFQPQFPTRFHSGPVL